MLYAISPSAWLAFLQGVIMLSLRSNRIYGILTNLFLATSLLSGCTATGGEESADQESAGSANLSTSEEVEGFYSPSATCWADCLNGTSVALTCSGGCSARDQYCNHNGLSLGGSVSCSGGGSTYCPSATCQPAPDPCGVLQYVITWGRASNCNAAAEHAAEVAREQVGYDVCEETIIIKRCNDMGTYVDAQIKYEYRLGPQ
jgi:hypothetical protein